MSETPKALPCPKCGRMPRATVISDSYATLSCYGWLGWAEHCSASATYDDGGGIVYRVVTAWNETVESEHARREVERRLREALKP